MEEDANKTNAPESRPDAGDASAHRSRSGTRSTDGSHFSSAASGAATAAGSIASTVASSLWTGATAVGNYMWSFWAAPPPPPSQNPSQSGTRHNALVRLIVADGAPRTSESLVGLQQLSQTRSQSTDAGIVMGHQRASSNPEKLTHIAYLEDSDYGIRLVGRTATGEDAIMTQDVISKIHAALPPRFRLCTKWRLIYSSPEYGFSLSTLFSQCRSHDGPALIVVRDDGDALFGVFATEAWRPHFGHYGTGECFLWRIESDGRIKKYGSTGKNAYFMISESSYLAAGCGEGRFGFWLDEELLNGQSHPVPTFDNDSLSSAPRFKCVNLEVWGLDMTPLE